MVEEVKGNKYYIPNWRKYEHRKFNSKILNRTKEMVSKIQEENPL